MACGAYGFPVNLDYAPAAPPPEKPEVALAPNEGRSAGITDSPGASGCETAVLRRPGDQKDTGMDVEEPKSFIDFVEAYMNIKKMPADLHQISTGNKITMIDTPRVWGSEMTEKGVSKAAADAVAEFAGMIASLLAKAEHTIDIVSLDAPTALSGMPSGKVFRRTRSGISRCW